MLAIYLVFTAMITGLVFAFFNVVMPLVGWGSFEFPTPQAWGMAMPWGWFLTTITYSLMITIALILYRLDIGRFAPEANIFAMMRKSKGKHPVIKYNDPTGRGPFMLGVTSEEDKLTYKNVPTTLFRTDKMTRAPADRTHDGFPVYNCYSAYSMMMDSNAAVSYKTIIDYVRTYYTKGNGAINLDWLDTDGIIELVGTDKDELNHDCEQYVRMYNPDIPKARIELDDVGCVKRDENGQVKTDVPENDLFLGEDDSLKKTRYDLRTYTLSKAVSEIQESMVDKYPKQGFFTWQAAYQANPLAHYSSDTDQAFSLHEDLVK